MWLTLSGDASLVAGVVMARVITVKVFANKLDRLGYNGCQSNFLSNWSNFALLLGRYS